MEKRLVSLSLILCILFTMCACGIEGKKGDPEKNEYEQYLQKKEDELESIKSLNGGTAPQMGLDEEDFIPSAILGIYSDKVVKSGDDAIASLKDVRYLYDMNDPAAEFVLASKQQVEGTSYYRLQQMYGEYEVFGKQLVVATDEAGKILSLTGDYDPLANIVDETTDVTKDEAKEIYSQYYGKASAEPTLVVYTLKEGYNELAWCIKDNATALISAKSGEILDSWANVYTAVTPTTGICKDKNGKETKFITALDDKDTKTTADDEYLIYDIERNISYKDLDSTTFTYNNATCVDTLKMYNFPVIKDEDNIWERSTEAVELQQTLSNVYDYYLKVLKLKSYDGNGGAIHAFVNDSFDTNNGFNCGPCKDPQGDLVTFLSFSAVGTEHKSLDGVGHEFTHSVQNYLLDNSQASTELAALMEAYSDVMGELIESYYDSQGKADWQIFGRNIMNPNGTAVKYKDKHWNGEAHNDSTVISHAIYEMYRAGLNDNAELAKLLYRTWQLLTGTSTFADYRMAMISAAHEMGLSTEKVNIIKKGFDDANVVIKEFRPDSFGSVSELTVKVKDSKGNKLEDAVVEVYLTKPSMMFGKVALVTTDSNGCVKIDLRYGCYKVIAKEPSHVSSSAELEIREAGDREIEITLNDLNDYSVYAPVIQNAIKENVSSYFTPRGFLYDIDGNGVDELCYVNMVALDVYGSSLPCFTTSVYTIEDGKAACLFDNEMIYADVGGPKGMAGIVSLNGKIYYAMMNEGGETGENSCRGGEYKLYSVNGSTASLKKDVFYTYYRTSGGIDYNQSYSEFDGVKKSYKDYESFLGSLDVIEQMSGSGDGGTYLSELYDIVLKA